MSNVEVIRGIYGAFGRGDIESVLAALHPEIEWVEAEIEDLLYGGTHRGREAVAKDVLAVMPQTWEKAAARVSFWNLMGISFPWREESGKELLLGRR